MVQQNAAGSLRVSLNSPFFVGGGRGAWKCALAEDGPATVLSVKVF